MTARFILAFAAANGLIATGAGALAAHALAGRLTPRELDLMETAVRFQFFHALAVFGCGLWLRQAAPAAVRWAAMAFAAGLVLFCGALYLLALTGWRPIAAAAPAGGLAFLLGWVFLFIAALRGSSK
jgi:uncharacterized membrane protein YgdD (TMEM256/DUF423 family)